MPIPDCRHALFAMSWLAIAGCGSTVIAGRNAGSPDGGAVCDADECVPPGTFPAMLPRLEGVQVHVDGDRVRVTFEPIAGARDYRIYPLPAVGSVNVESDGDHWIEGATYRCGGDREALRADFDLDEDVYGFHRTAADATLGYVFLEGGEGRVPVYRLGDPYSEPEQGGSCWVSWNDARNPVFTADETERATLRAAGWRDDGVQFYAAASGTPGTLPVYYDTTEDYVALGSALAPRNVFYVPGPELDAHAAGSPTRRVVFDVLTTATAETVPLKRVFYRPPCAPVHDQLAAGEGRFERIVAQGNQPVWEVQWSGMEATTTFVIEALDTGCPFQGHLSVSDVPANGVAQSAPFVTVASARTSALHHEIFLNGQHAPSSRPKAIARAFVKVAPSTPAAMDFHQGFSSAETAETFALVHDEQGAGRDYYFESTSFTAQLYNIEPDFVAVGVTGGELWTSYADWAAGVGALFRLTPRQTATMSASAYVHATMQVDIWATGRRYPQLLISSAMSPVQENLGDGVTINVQPFLGWPTVLELQFCDHVTWSVDNPCNVFRTEQAAGDPAPPRDIVGEHAGVMRLARIDLWASTQRAYVFLDGTPWMCAELPSGRFPAGPATVTFGDVLYHSGIDEWVVDPDDTYTFHREHMYMQTRRVFDNIGFTSGVSAPGWDARIVCATEWRD